MASIQKIFFKPQRGFREFIYDSNGNITNEGTLWELDGVIQETHHTSIGLTKQPIEFGASIADHAIRQPIIVRVQGVITNSPTLKQLGNNIPTDVEGGAGVIKQYAQGFTGERIQSAYAGLLKIMNKRQPMTLQTGLLNYENMVLTDMQVPNNKNNRLLLDLTFEEAIIVKPGAVGTDPKIVLASTTDEVDFVTALTALAGMGVGVVAGLINS